MLLYKNNWKVTHCQYSSEIFADKTNSKVKAHLSLQGQRVTCYIRNTLIEVVHRSPCGGWVWFWILLQRRTSFYFRLQGFVCCFSCAVDMAVWQIPTPFAWGHFHHYFKNLWILLQASRNSLLYCLLIWH